MYVILEGFVGIILGEENVLKLGPGQYFGEMSLLTGALRMADVVTTPPGCKLAVITRRALLFLIKQRNDIVGEMVHTMAVRKVRALALLKEGLTMKEITEKQILMEKEMEEKVKRHLGIAVAVGVEGGRGDVKTISTDKVERLKRTNRSSMTLQVEI